jgi:glycosyltransferase involved in cell wall biosynthesis
MEPTREAIARFTGERRSEVLVPQLIPRERGRFAGVAAAGSSAVGTSLAFAWAAPGTYPATDSRSSVLYICIPAYNEAQTVGVLLWRIRKVFQAYPRDYEILVFDDGSTDATAETLQPYTRVLPLTILGGPTRVGYDRAMDALCRAVSARTRYPRRDAMITMQGDFTDQPEYLPELVKRFEGGADLVVGERTMTAAVPAAVRRLQWVGQWTLRAFGASPGVTDPFGAYRLYRISLIRDLLKSAGAEPVVRGGGSSWAANLDLFLRAASVARKVETVPLDPRYDVRDRGSRIRPWADGVALFRLGRTAKSRRAAAT